MYDTLESKGADFSCTTINSIEELKSFISVHNTYKIPRKQLQIHGLTLNSDDFFPSRQNYIIYRGVKESKYRLITSLQFRWPEIQHFYPNYTQNNYLSQIIELLRSNLRIQQFLNKDGKTYTDISILALMQHYGLPTPLLDWTPNIEIGLNFAYDGINRDNKLDEISNYVSLYYINLYENYEIQAASYQRILADAKESLCKQDIINSVNHIDLSQMTLNSLFNVEDLGLDFFYIDYSVDAPLVEDIFGNVLSLINPNLALQEGAFIINFHSEGSLDYFWNKKMLTLRNNAYYNSENISVSENPHAAGIVPKTRINCVNINKDTLIQWIKTGGKKDHYDHCQESKELKESILETYYTWLLDGKKDLKYFQDTFIKNVETEEQKIAYRVFQKYSINNLLSNE
ncbi:MAG: FRG domain-containing protein [Bacteroidales bacterium]|nr:FRG domain-containing protein [Bacteroidales bacterium]